MRHDGIYLQHGPRRQHVDFPAACGRSVWVYGQTEIVKDLIALAVDEGQPIEWNVTADVVHDIDTGSPSVRFTDAAGDRRCLTARVIAGTDGFHGICRPAIPERHQSVLQWDYPYAWLGILADAEPATDDLIYARHENGFALYSMRSASVSRLYLQVPAGESAKNWSDDRIWAELQTRFGYPGWSVTEGEITDRSVLPMRSFVSAPMRYGSLALAGDSAHIVPPTGAKGLNLALSDVVLLARALTLKFHDGDERLFDSYADDAMARVWRATQFAYFMTMMMHVGEDPFMERMQQNQLDYVMNSPSAQAALAENYTGLPY